MHINGFDYWEAISKILSEEEKSRIDQGERYSAFNSNYIAYVKANKSSKNLKDLKIIKIENIPTEHAIIYAKILATKQPSKLAEYILVITSL